MIDFLVMEFLKFFNHFGQILFALLFLAPSSVWYTVSAQSLCFEWED